jgi:hypothetical protein
MEAEPAGIVAVTVLLAVSITDTVLGGGIGVGDIDLGAVGGDRYAPGEAADGDRRGHRIACRVDHRDGVGPSVRDVGVLREALSAAEKAGKSNGGDREQPGNAKFHGILSDNGSLPAVNAKG